MAKLEKLLPAQSRERIETLVAASPSPALARNQLSRLIEDYGIASFKKIPPSELPALVRLLGSSAYLSDVLLAQGKQWPEVFLRQLAIDEKSANHHLKELQAAVTTSQSLDDFCAALRRHKQREFLRIGARDLLPSAPMEATVRELTSLAEGALQAAYRFCRSEVEKDFGVLKVAGTESAQRFVVLGMGKLGGGELNFSSDIDVIFLYEDDDGESSGGRRGKVIPRDFFTALGKQIIRVMGEVTEDGFIFRIDLRLRPLGANGPLVQSVGSAMVYYESWGQCWERAALIKARPVAGEVELGTSFLKEIEPFIYRRYLDYTTVDELRHMKMRIESELLDPRSKERNIKLGVGGIREIEFFTQALQLVNGGYVPEVRGQQTMPALTELARHNFIANQEKQQLVEAYRFLRQVEHKVQMVQEAHAHSIPEGDDEEQALARRLGYTRQGRKTERALFWRDHRLHASNVRAIFDRLFYGAHKEITTDRASGVGSIWNDLDRQELIINELEKIGFADPAKAYTNLLAVRDGEVYAPPS
ncbi:MAG TPA: bifunctional [glutamate--ammonia ligase]-adenylyl-L-tyrosine phosphorylase/[glutamate--ammonia-ligase] adenylyltransferase, partial [Candidatus Binatia bacterium]